MRAILGPASTATRLSTFGGASILWAKSTDANGSSYHMKRDPQVQLQLDDIQVARTFFFQTVVIALYQILHASRRMNA